MFSTRVINMQYSIITLSFYLIMSDDHNASILPSTQNLLITNLFHLLLNSREKSNTATMSIN